MPSKMTASPPPTANSRETAERGCVLAAIGDYRQLLSHAEAWQEDGLYIVRSTEFDLMADDEDFDQALDKFATWLLDYGTHLATLAGEREATDDELETFATISARILPLFQKMEQQDEARQRKEDPSRHAQRKRRANIWRHQETRASSSGQLSAA